MRKKKKKQELLGPQGAGLRKLRHMFIVLFLHGLVLPKNWIVVVVVLPLFVFNLNIFQNLNGGVCEISHL